MSELTGDSCDRTEPDDDPANSGVEDEFQDLVGRVREKQGETVDAEPDVSCGSKLPPDHPDADLLDDLDL